MPTAPTHDPRAELAMKKYMAVLNEIQAIGPLGFAAVLDTASPQQMNDLISAVDIVQREIDRMKRT